MSTTSFSAVVATNGLIRRDLECNVTRDKEGRPTTPLFTRGPVDRAAKAQRARQIRHERRAVCPSCQLVMSMIGTCGC